MTSNAATVALSSAAIRDVLSKDKFTKLAMDPDPEGRFLLHDECKEPQPNEFFIGELLKYQPDRISRINDSGEVPLHCACQNLDNIDISLLTLLLESYSDGARVANNKGYLPLHKAVSVASAVPGGDDLFSLKQRKIMKSLGLVLEAFPDALSLQNMEGQLPLHVAASRPASISLSVVQLLCQYYPEAARITDDYGHLPLHKSVQVARAEKASPQAVELLLELFPKGAVYQDYRGFTPLHWAASHRNPHLEILAILLAHSPQAVKMRDYDGMCPLDRMLRHEGYSEPALRMFLDTQEQLRKGLIAPSQFDEEDEDEEEEQDGGRFL